MRVAAIHQPQYLPYLGFFHKLAHCDVFVALDHVQFQKNGLQNRNKIKNSTGWQWLTVPVSLRFGQSIGEVLTDAGQGWARKHCTAITCSYASARHFAEYSGALLAMLAQPWDKLVELNTELMRWGMSVLSIGTPVVRSTSLSVPGQKTEMLIDICRAVNADHYLSGPGGRRYMDLAAFEAAGITVLWQEFEASVYDQVFPQAGFVPNLSFIDAVFACGPDTRALLK